MGESLSKATQVEELVTFKKLPTNTLLDNIEIPERAENRKPTDRKFLIIFAVVVLILFPFLIYGFVTGDLARLWGYDQCGNVCGRQNPKYQHIECSGQDFTDKPYLEIDGSSNSYDDSIILRYRRCVTECGSNYVKIFNKCYLKKSTYSAYDDDRFKRSADIEDLDEFGDNVAQYLNKNAWRIVLACFISLGVAIIMLVLFKTATAAVVWSILGGVLLMGAIFVGGLWYLYFNVDHWSSNKKDDGKQGVMVMAIVFTVVWLVLLCVTIFMYKKVQLVIQLLKEATKASFAMPMLIFVPIITLLAELVIIALLVFTSLYLTTSGSLEQLTSDFYFYQEGSVVSFTMIFNVIVAFWSTQFVIGIQYMVIAGAVATWYWSKNKNNLDRPIAKSANVAFKFHLGSVALGSLVITIIAIIRALLSSLTKNKNLKIFVDMCIGSLESFLKFLSKNSYILTAMHGKPFYKSGKRAAKIIFQNVVNIASVNYIGDFVLGMAQFLIVLISVLISVGIMQGTGDNAIFAHLIVGFVSVCIAYTFFATFETTIDTLFLCFCEDSLLNDGMARPYAMSRDLMEFVENSKKLYGEKKN